MDWRPPELRAGGAHDPHFRARDGERIGVDGEAQLRHRSWYAIEVKVRDVSTRGFMAECAEAVEIGSNVSLDIPGIGPVHAQVRWQIGPCMGGMFLDPISLRRCEWVGTRADAPVEDG